MSDPSAITDGESACCIFGTGLLVTGGFCIHFGLGMMIIGTIFAYGGYQHYQERQRTPPRGEN